MSSLGDSATGVEAGSSEISMTFCIRLRVDGTVAVSAKAGVLEGVDVGDVAESALFELCELVGGVGPGAEE